MTETILFYTTLGCHLCDEAKAIWQATLNPEFFTVEEVEIADSDVLIEQYGSRIPVLKRMKDGTELGWPFSVQQLIAFLPE
jgi:hypothetical protein